MHREQKFANSIELMKTLFAVWGFGFRGTPRPKYY